MSDETTLGDAVSALSGATLSGSFTDPQPNIPHVVTVNWGDGTEESPDITTVVLAAGQTTFTAQPNSTTYATAGDYTITATVAGMDGSTTASTSVTVTAVSAEVMIGATTPVASEYLGSDAAFAITCGGGSAGNVTIDFSIDTDLVYGADANDYTLSCSGGVMTIATDGLTGTIVMAGDVPGMATIYVVPNYPYPAVTASSQTVELTLESGTGYTVMSGWTTATAGCNPILRSRMVAVNRDGLNDKNALVETT